MGPLWSRAKSASPGFEPCVAYVELHVDAVALGARLAPADADRPLAQHAPLHRLLGLLGVLPVAEAHEAVVLALRQQRGSTRGSDGGGKGYPRVRVAGSAGQPGACARRARSRRVKRAKARTFMKVSSITRAPNAPNARRSISFETLLSRSPVVRVRVRVRVRVSRDATVQVACGAPHGTPLTARPRLVRVRRTYSSALSLRYVQHAGGWYAWPARTVRRRPRDVRVSLAGRRRRGWYSSAPSRRGSCGSRACTSASLACPGTPRCEGTRRAGVRRRGEADSDPALPLTLP